MKERGNVFLDWAGFGADAQAHEKALDNGTHIDVRVRSDGKGSVSAFVGIYSVAGLALHEEIVKFPHEKSASRALACAVARARRVSSYFFSDEAVPEAS